RTIHTLRQDARQYLEECKLYAAVAGTGLATVAAPTGKAPLKRLQACLATAEAHRKQLLDLSTPKYFRGDRVLWLCGGLGLVLIVLSGLLLLRLYGLTGGLVALAGSTVVVSALGGGLAAWLYAQAKQQARTVYQPLEQVLAEVEVLLPVCLERGTAKYQR